MKGVGLGHVVETFSILQSMIAPSTYGAGGCLAEMCTVDIVISCCYQITFKMSRKFPYKFSSNRFHPTLL